MIDSCSIHIRLTKVEQTTNDSKRFFPFPLLEVITMQKLLATWTCLTAMLFLVGCGAEKKPEKAPVKSAESDHGHEHSHGSAPHGGTLTDWGGGAYHVEFTVDHDKKESVIYIIGSDAKTPAPVKASKVLLSIKDPEFDMELTAKPLDGEAEGTSSRFIGQHDNLGKVQEFAGTISGEVDGTPYTGDFKEEPHDAGHKH